MNKKFQDSKQHNVTVWWDKIMVNSNSILWWGGNFPGGQFSLGQLFSGAIIWGAIIQGPIIRGGQFSSEAIVLEPLIKFAGIQACNFIKRRLRYRCFRVNIGKFLWIPIKTSGNWHHYISLFLFYHCRKQSFESCFLNIAVPKFQKSSVGIQHTTLTLLENRLLHNYFSRFLPTSVGYLVIA